MDVERTIKLTRSNDQSITVSSGTDTFTITFCEVPRVSDNAERRFQRIRKPLESVEESKGETLGSYFPFKIYDPPTEGNIQDISKGGNHFLAIQDDKAFAIRMTGNSKESAFKVKVWVGGVNVLQHTIHGEKSQDYFVVSEQRWVWGKQVDKTTARQFRVMSSGRERMSLRSQLCNNNIKKEVEIEVTSRRLNRPWPPPGMTWDGVVEFIPQSVLPAPRPPQRKPIIWASPPPPHHGGGYWGLFKNSTPRPLPLPQPIMQGHISNDTGPSLLDSPGLEAPASPSLTASEEIALEDIQHPSPNYEGNLPSPGASSAGPNGEGNGYGRIYREGMEYQSQNFSRLALPIILKPLSSNSSPMGDAQIASVPPRTPHDRFDPLEDMLRHDYTLTSASPSIFQASPPHCISEEMYWQNFMPQVTSLPPISTAYQPQECPVELTESVTQLPSVYRRSPPLPLPLSQPQQQQTGETPSLTDGHSIITTPHDYEVPTTEFVFDPIPFLTSYPSPSELILGIGSLRPQLSAPSFSSPESTYEVPIPHMHNATYSVPFCNPMLAPQAPIQSHTPDFQRPLRPNPSYFTEPPRYRKRGRERAATKGRRRRARPSRTSHPRPTPGAVIDSPNLPTLLEVPLSFPSGPALPNAPSDQESIRYNPEKDMFPHQMVVGTGGLVEQIVHPDKHPEWIDDCTVTLKFKIVDPECLETEAGIKTTGNPGGNYLGMPNPPGNIFGGYAPVVTNPERLRPDIKSPMELEMELGEILDERDREPSKQESSVLLGDSGIAMEGEKEENNREENTEGHREGAGGENDDARDFERLQKEAKNQPRGLVNDLRMAMKRPEKSKRGEVNIEAMGSKQEEQKEEGKSKLQKSVHVMGRLLTLGR